MAKEKKTDKVNEENPQQEEIKPGKETKSRATKKKEKAEDKQKEKIAELETQVAESKDKYLRLYSEFDNYRKRTLKEKTDLYKTASEGVIKELLPVIDDLERAIKSFEESGSEKDYPMLEGVKIIYNKFKGILEQKGLEPMKSLGEAFDVDFHEAMTNIPAPSEDLKGKVVDEIEKGYMLNGKVIRYAKVVVGN
jgi:molecular chaperone GrpE